MTLDERYWQPRTLAPIPTLADLREQVLRRSERRCPKWKFRLGPELILQLQPKPSVVIAEVARTYGVRQHVLDFQGCAVFGPDLTAAVFSAGGLDGVPSFSFRL